VKGIGRWTAEMFLIFHEMRADVFPVGDIGLQTRLRATTTTTSGCRSTAYTDCRRVATVAQRRVVVPVALARSDPGQY
jgi:3-methyladenine DNA glycosylase/8-oxoguanine DNA glycosylase